MGQTQFMNSERQMRLNLLEGIRGLYLAAMAAGEVQQANGYVREMIPHCNRLLVPVVDYLNIQHLIKGPDVPAAPAPAPSAEPPPQSPGFTCTECGRQFTEAARYYGHLSSHTRARKGAQGVSG